MKFTEDELRRLKTRAKLADKPSAQKCTPLEEIRALLDEYERQHLTPRNLQFTGRLLPRIAAIARATGQA